MAKEEVNGLELEKINSKLIDNNGDSTQDKNNVKDVEVKIENYANKALLYGINDTPPIHVTIICGIQQGLMSLSAQLVVSLLVAEAVCAADDDMFKSRLLSSTLFMSGVTTVAMNIVGIRLPFFQGAASEYVVPLLLIANVDGTFCSSLTKEANSPIGANMTGNETGLSEVSMERILSNTQALQGSLMVAGVIHTLLGMTGMIGLLVRFIGPLTIVPTMVLIWIFIVRAVMKFVEPNWGIAFSTIVVAVILFLYLGKYNMPVPVWTPKGGFRIVRYPLHQVFSILIAILLNWMLCGILTVAGVLTDDKNDIGYRTRTDAAGDLIASKPWFSFPYPGQFGSFGFSGPAFISCLIATFISILDSIGDYYACARVCRVPAPPAHAVNRGIMIEGACSFIAGTIGCGHATSTYGGNIGAIGVTKVASRWVFICTGVIYIIFGLFGKISAVFITIPYPVLGGAIVVLYGIFFGVVVSNLEVTAMSSPRNMAILGLSMFIGLLVPTWVEKVGSPINTGMEGFDSMVAMLLGNPNLVGTILACFLDNTVSGTVEERGIAAWQKSESDITAEMKLDNSFYNEGYEVYQPLLPKSFLNLKVMNYIPFLPNRKVDQVKKSQENGGANSDEKSK